MYLRALVDDLREEGILSPDAQIDSVEDLLTAMEGTLGQAADTVDMPPLNVDDMRQSWNDLREQAATLPGASTLAQIYADLQSVAHREGQSVYRTSSLIAVGAVRTGIKMGNVHIFDYYRTALDSIFKEGLGTLHRARITPLPQCGAPSSQPKREYVHRASTTPVD